jgi:hypothetical protein
MTNPRAALVLIAQKQIGIHETSQNHGDGIAKFWTATNYPDGYANREPYCAAFVCWLVMQALSLGYALGLTASTRPREAAVRNFVAWAHQPASGALVFAPGDTSYEPSAGDVVWFEFGGDHPDHVGLVESFDGHTVRTIEANTGATGGRDGDGVYQKSRALNLCRGFIRLAWKAAAA